VYSKLRSSSDDERDYVYEFLFLHLDEFLEKPPPLMQHLAAERLKAGDQRFFDAMNTTFLWNDEWNEKVRDLRQNFQPAHPVLDDDEEVPF
jgi:hypothetical protein